MVATRTVWRCGRHEAREPGVEHRAEPVAGGGGGAATATVEPAGEPVPGPPVPVVVAQVDVTLCDRPPRSQAAVRDRGGLPDTGQRLPDRA